MNVKQVTMTMTNLTVIIRFTTVFHGDKFRFEHCETNPNGIECDLIFLHNFQKV